MNLKKILFFSVTALILSSILLSCNPKASDNTSEAKVEHFRFIQFSETPFDTEKGTHSLTEKEAQTINNYKFTYDEKGRLSSIEYCRGDEILSYGSMRGAATIKYTYEDNKQIKHFFNEANDYQPFVLLGSDTAFMFFFISIITLVSLLILQLYQTKNPLPTRYISILLILTVPIFSIALFEFIAPKWILASKGILSQDLGQPHHCPFCLIKRWPLMAITILSSWIGFASMGWYSIIEWKTSKDEELSLPLSQLLIKLRLTSIISISIALLLIIGHIFFFLLNNALFL